MDRRVPQYFHHQDSRPKVEKMVPQITRFEYIVTASEMEALILECNLIKEYRPKYNTMLKDDKSYPYIKVTVGEAYPQIFITRQMKKDTARYFGPYTNVSAVRETVDLLKKMYGIRDCRRRVDGGSGQSAEDEEGSPRERECLNYHIHQCPGPCIGAADKEAYDANVQAVLRILSGNAREIIASLKTEMLTASEELRFEDAGRFKAKIDALKSVLEKQNVSTKDSEDTDIIALACEDGDALVQVFFVRDGKLIGREHFYIRVAEGDDRPQILRSFLLQYYAGTPMLPKAVLLSDVPEDTEEIVQWLSEKRGSKVNVVVPQKGHKERLLTLAMQNAALVLSRDRERILREEGRTIGAVRELSDLIGIPYAKRIEAYDISNISGYQNVGSMVVYDGGKPLRNDYRKFRIKTVVGQDDYGSMYEVLTRRFMHGLASTSAQEDSFTRFPDLILMDGGRGQVNICLKVLEELDLSIPVCGMVKDDHHRTRGLYVNNREIPIAKDSEAFALITRIQNEAHRFAITFHRSLRSKDQVHSVLDEIKGIGPARRKALMQHFDSIEQIREADVEELAGIDGMSRQAAENVVGFFRASIGEQEAKGTDEESKSTDGK